MKPQFKHEEIYLDLSKLSEEQQRKVIALLPIDNISAQIYFMGSYEDWNVIKKFTYLFFNDNKVWQICDSKREGKQELTYSQFLDMMGESEEEVLQVENDYQDLKESHSELFRRLNQLRNRYKLDNLDKCLGRAKEINRKYANNKGFKIVQSDKNNVFFLDECIFTYCPTPNECKNGGCLSKSNNQ